MQMALMFAPSPAAPSVSNKRDRILAVLRDGRWHGGEEFMDGRHGFYCSSYSQRIGQLIRAGYLIERSSHTVGDATLGRYRLIAPSPFEDEGVAA